MDNPETLPSLDTEYTKTQHRKLNIWVYITR